MAGITKFSKLSFVSSLLKLQSKPRAFTPSSFYRLGISSTSATNPSPRTFIPFTFTISRNYSSYDDDINRKNTYYSDSDEFPASQQRNVEKGNVSKPRYERRSSKPFASDFNSNNRQPHFDDYEDDYNFERPRSFSQRDNRSRPFDSDYDRTFKSGRLGSNIKAKDWNASTLSPFEKNFYVRHTDVEERTSEEIESYYRNHNITVSRGEKPVPLSDFHEANFPEKVVNYLESNDWSSPTPIQSLGWPLALSGKNMVGLAQTGSGKTLGFILPALVHAKHQRPVDRGEGPIVLVLAPTRELAQQIKGVAVEYGRLLGIRSCSVFGGQSKLVQARTLSQGPELVVATPGRLLDFIESQVIDLGRTTYVVLDEADRMLDMGFEPQIRKVLGQIRPDRQILMWSATWPNEIQQLAHDFLGDFTQVNIGSQELTANPNIEQVVKVCEMRGKLRLLMEELKNQCSASEDGSIPKTLIFGRTKRTVDFLSDKLRRHKIRVHAIHGDKSQQNRDRALDLFRNGRVDVLVATDVAARGLDVDDIKLVINYDFPNTIDDYIHRIGRTARATKTGKAVTFVTDDDAANMKDLVSTLKSADQHVDPELYELATLHSKFSKKSSSRYTNSRHGYGRKQTPRFGNNNRYNSNRFDDWDY